MMNCLLPSCSHANKMLSEKDDRIRVRFDLNQKDFDRLPFPVLSGGIATFHLDCWQSLLADNTTAKRQGESARRRHVGRLLRRANETAEYWNGRSKIEEQVGRVVQLLKASSKKRPHVVVFTGAGISTSAGIGDFRGIFGQWTEDEMKHDMAISNDDDELIRPTDDVSYQDLRPTLAHEVVAWMANRGLVNHVITQNCDGLHRLSGVESHKLSELHGNVFVEYCKKGCGKEYERPYDVENADANEYFEALAEEGSPPKRSKRAIRRVEQCGDCQLTHQTIRSCDQCRLPLFDTIINFGDTLRDSQLEPATENAKKADVVIVLGSTLLVTPAADLCEPQEQALVICNRQTTPLDEEAAVRIFGDCDVFMSLLLSKLIGNATEFETWIKGRESRMAEYDRVKRVMKK